jgi:hypothetical protein
VAFVLAPHRRPALYGLVLLVPYWLLLLQFSKQLPLDMASSPSLNLAASMQREIREGEDGKELAATVASTTAAAAAAATGLGATADSAVSRVANSMANSGSGSDEGSWLHDSKATNFFYFVLTGSCWPLRTLWSSAAMRHAVARLGVIGR